MSDNFRPHRVPLVDDFFFQEGITGLQRPACLPNKNTGVQNSMFEAFLANDLRLLITSTNFPRTGKSSSGGVEQNTPNFLLIVSLTPFLKGIQSYWLL